MALYYLAGTGYNQLTRMVTAASPESASSLYPIANLYDGAPVKPFMFNTAGTSGYIDFDMQQIPNGTMESTFSGGLPASGWAKSGTVTCARDTVVFNEGAASANLTAAGGSGDGIYYDWSVRPGEILVMGAQVRSDAGGATFRGRIRNMSTGNYLNTSNAWQAAAVNRIVSTSSTWNTFSSQVTVESYAACGYQDRVTIRLEFTYGSAPINDAWVDGVLCYPIINFASIHGHNIQPNTAPIELRADTTTTPTTVRGTFTLAHPTMFVTFSNVLVRYWRLFFTNDPLLNPTWIGELVLGQYSTARRRQNYGQDYGLIDPQDRVNMDVGQFASYLRTMRGRRQVQMNFRLNDSDDYAEQKEIAERSRNGAYPILAVVESGDTTTAIMGRIDPTWRHSRVTKNMRDTSWLLDELPFPVVVA